MKGEQRRREEKSSFLYLCELLAKYLNPYIAIETTNMVPVKTDRQQLLRKLHKVHIHLTFRLRDHTSSNNKFKTP
jgi:hypothetical protein